MRRNSDNRFPGGWIVVLGSLLFAGCGKKTPDLPETFPVTGEVRYLNGDSIAKGLIQFQSESNPSLNVSGAIVDGKFSLITAFANGAAPGTMAGRYRVSITPAFEVTPKTIQLPETYEVRAEATVLDIKVGTTSK